MTRKDYLMDVRVYNNNLLQAIKNAGYTSVPKFCKAHDLNYQEVNRLLAMKLPILKADRTVHPTVTRLLVVLNKRMDELFNEQQMAGLESNRAVREVSAEAMFSMMHSIRRIEQNPEESLIDGEVGRLIDASLKGLSAKELDIINKRFGLDGPEMTLEAIGNLYGVSGACIRSIEAKALRKLRHPVPSGHLRHAFLDDDSYVKACDTLREQDVLNAEKTTK